MDLYKIKIKLLLKRILASPEINPGEYVTIVGKVKQIPSNSISGSNPGVFTVLSDEKNNLSNGNSIEL